MAPGVVPPKCDYCGREARKKMGRDLYPMSRHLWLYRFWACDPCGAYVGTHRKPEWAPLGRLANKELRLWKMKAHNAFDVIWKNGKMKRTEAYEWLSIRLGITVDQCHIGEFDVSTCKRVVEVMKQ